MAQTTANLVGSCLSSRQPLATSDLDHEAANVSAVAADHLLDSASEARKAADILNADKTSEELEKPSKRRRLQRFVEQVDHEPIGIVIFKWCLIVVGTIMLGIVLFFMGEVIYAWSTGQLEQENKWALANFTAMKNNNSDANEP